MQVQDTIKSHTRGRGTALCICEHCGDPFLAKPYRVKIGQARFCSGGCVAMAKRSAYVCGLAASEADLAYLAGMIDGEGCITIIKDAHKRATGPRYRLRLYVTNISSPLMDWLSATFGGRVHSRKADSGKVVYHWCAADSAVETILRLALPYLKVKGEQARLALEFRPDPLLFSSHRLSSEEVGRRDRIWLAMSTLNAAGGRVRVLR